MALVWVFLQKKKAKRGSTTPGRPEARSGDALRRTWKIEAASYPPSLRGRLGEPYKKLVLGLHTNHIGIFL